jgi:predicted RNA-binding Zn-ribbon protein involved in translation (DUF1610 family)
MLPISENKSRPLYPGLSPQIHARSNLIAAEGQGAAAVLELFAKGPANFAARSIILFTADKPTADAFVPRLEALGVDRLQTFPTIDTLLVRLDGFLSTAHMGTRLYATGTEGFIGRIVQSGIARDIVPGSILTEHRGSMARRVQCVHCKGITENITLSHFTCSHCGLTLFVRDHFSRRLGAFQGVCANAEDRTLVPSVTELFP